MGAGDFDVYDGNLPSASNGADSSGSGSGGGAYGGSSGPTDNDRKAYAAQGAVSGYNNQTTLNSGDQGFKIYDTADTSAANFRTTQTNQNLRNSTNDWYTQQQKLQSVNSSLADMAGNAMYGSFALDLADAIARKDDMDDVAVLNQMRQNQNTIDNDYWETIIANANARNELARDTEADLRTGAADYVANVNNIHPDLAADLIDADGHTLKVPEWLKTSYFDEHFVDAINPTTQGLYRPENAAAVANQQGLVNNTNSSQYSSSGNQDYWTRMRQGYSRRTQ